EFGRHSPWTTWAATPAAPTATATENRLRWATCSAPIVAAVVATGKATASRVAVSVPATGHHSWAIAPSRLTTPTATSSRDVDPCPHLDTPVSVPTPRVTLATATGCGEGSSFTAPG